MQTSQEVNISKTIQNQSQHIKFPSDTTIYAPALNKVISPVVCGTIYNEPNMNQIVSDFVDTMPLEHRQEEMSASLQEKERRRASMEQTEETPFDRAREKSTKSVVEAEKFKAMIGQPNAGRHLDFLQTINDHSSERQLVQQCNEFQTDSHRPISIPDLGSGVSDDDFFHLTCHIEPNLIHKIEKGNSLNSSLVPNANSLKD